MSQKNIVTALIIFLIMSFSFLAYTEQGQHKIENEWFLYFENPHDKTLSFIIENLSDKNEFTWTLLADNRELKSGNIEVLKNTYKTVNIEQLPKGERFIIKIANEDSSKEIYKII